jgi:hypothetical protein
MDISTSHRQPSTGTGYNSTAHNLHHFNYHSGGNADYDCYIYLYCLHNHFHINNHFHQYDIIDQFQLHVDQEFNADQHDHIVLLHWNRY